MTKKQWTGRWKIGPSYSDPPMPDEVHDWFIELMLGHNICLCDSITITIKGEDYGAIKEKKQ